MSLRLFAAAGIAAALALGPASAPAPAFAAEGAARDGQTPAVAESGGAGDGGAGSDLGIIEEIIRLIQEEYRGEANRDQLLKGAIQGILETLGDPYSYYMDPEEYKRFTEEMSGSFGGIGVHIEARDGFVTIVSVIPGTPADDAGIEPGDRLLAVDGQSLQGASVERAVGLIRGRPGTEVRLTIDRGGRTMEITLTRAVIELPSVDTNYMAGNIGYIKISQFNTDTGRQFRFIYDRLVSIGARAIIVDLRNNPGGLLTEAVEVAQTLVPKGDLVHVVDNRGGRLTLDTVPHKPGPPLVVLVNGGSASASEIVAGAVQDNRAGILVGTRTFGKGSVQSVIELPNGGALRLTTARYLTPRQRSIDGTGLVPDVVVEEADPNYQPPAFAAVGGRTLRAGMVGLDVLGLQQRLNYLGFSAGPEDGVFGPRTLAGLRAFQRARGVAEAHRGRAIAGPRTFAALEKAVQEQVAARRRARADLPLQKAVELINRRAVPVAAAP